MSIANIGERDNKPGANPAPRQGKKCMSSAARPLSPSRLIRAKGRDTLLEEELKTMAEAAKDRDGDIMNLDPERQKHRNTGKGRDVKRALDSNIFGEAVQLPQPKMRIRPDVGEDALSKLMSEDRRKEDAAQALAGKDDMVTKMVKSDYPFAINKESGRYPAKKRFDEPAVAPDVAVEGFAGMGARSNGAARQGVSVKPQEPFVPEPKPSARLRGKRMVGSRPDAQGDAGGALGSGSYAPSQIF